jgi:hypothetical protein
VTAHLKAAVMTTPGDSGPLLADLPRGPEAVAAVARGLAVHLPWDVWGAMPAPDAPINGEWLELFDQLAALIRDPNLSIAELATRYAEDDPSCPPHRLQHDAEPPGVLAMFADPEASPVMPAIGTGAGHLVGVLDYGLTRAHPELFTGFSNPTVLNKAIRAAVLRRRGGR